MRTNRVFLWLILVAVVAGVLWWARQPAASRGGGARRPIANVPDARTRDTASARAGRTAGGTESTPAGAAGTAATRPAPDARRIRERLTVKRVAYTAAREIGQRVDFEQIQIAETDFHYPLVRFLDVVRHDPATGEDAVVRSEAMVADHVVVRARAGVSRSALTAAAEREGLRVRRVVADDRTFLLEFPIDHDDPLPHVLSRLQSADDWVELAEPDFLRSTFVVPNEPAATGVQWALQSIRAWEAWDTRTDASSSVVAVVDTGARLTHEDLAENLWSNPGESGNGRDANGVDDDGNGYVDDVHGINAITGKAITDDDHGHGTHVAGIIGARGNNGKGIAGVAWQAKLMPLEFLNFAGVGTDSGALVCLAYARGKGVRVINNSWGGQGESELLRQSLEACVQQGAVVVSAAGNSAMNIDFTPVYPAGYSFAGHVSVASIDRNGRLSGFSNFGPVSMAAPGDGIYSAWHENDASYRSLSGTSMAAPMVSGAVALLASQYPSETPAVLASRLISGATPSADLAEHVAYGRRLDLRAPLAEASFIAAPTLALSVPQTVHVGDAVELVATADGAAPFTYSWRFDGIVVPGANGPRLLLNGIQPSQAGEYSVVVANSVASVRRRTTVSVIGPPSIVAPPLGQTAVEGNDVFVTVSARANGAARLSYQWLCNGAIVAGQKTETLRLERIQRSQAGRYKVVISSEHGSITSEEAVVEVIPAEAPAIVAEPADRAVMADQDVTFSLSASGTPALTYAWLKDGAPIPGETSATLRILRAQQADAGEYAAAVTNSAGTVTSRTARLTVQFAPVTPFIARQPSSRTAFVGQAAELHAVAKGTPTPALQWLHNGTALPGATQASLSIARVTTSDEGEYSVVATNSTGSCSSETAFLKVESAFGQQPWEWRNPLPQGNDLLQIISADGGFVAVGRFGMTMTSPNALAWTIRTSGVTDDLYDAAANGRSIVVVGMGGTILLSEDAGITWARQFSGTAKHLRGIAYGNGMYVVVGEGGLVYTSPDGRGWTQRNSGISAFIAEVIHDGSRFVAATTGGQILISHDAVTWSIHSIGTNQYIRSLSYGNGVYLAVSMLGPILTSADGVNWTLRRQEPGYLHGGFFAQGMFVVMKINGEVLTSPDGLAWTPRSTGFHGFPYGIAHGGGLFVIVGESGAVVTSPDAIAWTTRLGGSIDVLESVTWGPPGYVAVGSGQRVLWSPTGVLWSRIDVGAPSFQNVLYSNGQYVAMGQKVIGTSQDGRNWTMKAAPAVNGMHALAHGAGTYVVVGAGGIATSSDLVTWTARDAGTTMALSGVTYGAGQFVAVGESGTVVTSADGQVWSQHPIPTSISLHGVAYGAGRYVAVGSNKQIFHSTDAGTWTGSGLPIDYPTLYGVTYAADHFIVVGGSGALLTSIDGLAWIERNAGSRATLMTICHGNESFVAAGGGEVILQSGGFTSAHEALTPFPARQVVVAGNTVRLEMSLLGDDAPMLQWYKDGAAVAGGTSRVLELHEAQVTDAGSYTVRIGDAATGAMSQPAYVAVVAVQGTGLDVPLRGGSVFFNVIAPAGFNWTAGTSADWATLAGTSGSAGDGTTSFAVSRNTTGQPRSAEVVVGGTTLVIRQEGSPLPASSRLRNLATRGFASSRPGEELIAGFFLAGGSSNRVLVRAAGPALAGFGVVGEIADPRVTVVPGSGPVIENDDWGQNAAETGHWTDRVGAFPFAAGSRDSGLVIPLAAGAHTAFVRGADQTEGIVLLEVYEANGTDGEMAAGRLLNISTRGLVRPGSQALIAGFVLDGDVPRRFLIRGVGPGLAAYGVANRLSDPRLTLFSGNRVIAENDDWDAPYAHGGALAAEAAAVGAFELAPGSKDAGLLLMLAPGLYTVHLNGANGETGVGLVEIYDVN